MNSPRYCGRCGEDAHEIIICDGCGSEFCTDCGTGLEVMAETCEQCLVEEAYDDPPAPLQPLHVIPSMREWCKSNGVPCV